MAQEREVPPGAAVGFAETDLAAELPCHRNALFRGVIDGPVFGEKVDSGRLHVFVEAHCGADIHALADQTVFTEHMPGEHQIVLPAPFADLFGERFDKQIRHNFIMIQADAGTLLPVDHEKEFRQMIQKVITVAFPSLFHHGIGPVGVVRFVGEDSGNGSAEVAGDFPRVFLMGDLDEFPDGFRIAGVQIGAAVVPVEIFVDKDKEAEERLAVFQSISLFQTARIPGFLPAPLRGKPCQIGIGIFNVVQFLDFEPSPPEFGMILCHESACGAGGPAVFIVEPGVHSVFLRFVDAGTDAGKPVFAQIGGVEADAGVHEKSAQAHLFHVPDLSAEFLRFQFAVPGPERSPAKFRRRIFCFFKKLLNHFFMVSLFCFFSGLRII